MRAVIPNVKSMVVVIGLCLASVAFGQVNFGITSAEANNLAGVYTDPYNGCVGCTASDPGTAVQAFCDDFTDDVNPPQYWVAFATNLSAFPGTPTVSSVYYTGSTSYSFISGSFSQTTDYIAAAILAVQSLNAVGDSTTQNDLSFALWGIFDTGLLSQPANSYGTLSAGDLSAAQTYLSNALALASTYATGSDYEAATGVNAMIYTADVNGTVESDSGRPQEFITVAMPEPPAMAGLLFDSVAFGIIGLAFRRRQSKTRS